MAPRGYWRGNGVYWAVTHTDCDTCCSTHSRRSRHDKANHCVRIARTLPLFFFVDIVVGFEKSSYSIAEGENLEICVTIISPDDIGSTRVFLEVVPDEDAAENTASKPVRVSHCSKVV